MSREFLNSISPNQSSVVWLSGLRFGLILLVLFLGLAETGQDEVDSYRWLVVFCYSLLGVLFVLYRDAFEEQTNIAISLLVDILFISWFLYTHQGVMSGWVSALLFPALIGSLICSRKTAWLIAGLAILSYGILTYLHLEEMSDSSSQENIMQHNMPMQSEHHQHMSHPPGSDQSAMDHSDMKHSSMDMSSHIEGMMITFCISVILLTGFISHQADLIRRHQKSLGEMRERQLREQQIMAFATLSANTTHRLASPISSITMLLEELAESEPTGDWQDNEVYQQICAQVQRCEQILHKLAASTRDYDPDKLRKDAIQNWLPELIESWWVTRNEVQYQLNMDEGVKSLQVEYDDNLSFALMNLLDNAANACKDSDNPLVRIDVTTAESGIDIVIQDNGAGIDDSKLIQFGQRFVKSASGGLGIGAALAHAAIQQAGGRVSLVNNGSQAGTRISVFLPQTR